MPPLPDHLELFPTTDAAGKCTQWEGSTAFSLSAPTPAMKYPDPVPVYQNLIVVSGETVLKAAKLVESCETCNSVGAEIPFDWILDQVTGSDSTVTDYIIESPAKCPTCQRPIFEKTLVEPRD